MKTQPSDPMKRFLQKAYVVFLVLFAVATGKGYTQNVDFGKSYVNISKGANGGTIEPNDTLEIRSVFVVRSGTYDSCAYFDAVPAGTTYLPGTIRVLTNEGKVYKQFTDALFDDEGSINGTNVRINLGYNQTAAPSTRFRRGRISNTHKPSFFSSSCIMVASFRVRVNVPLGSIINTGGGSMTYKSGSNPIQTHTFPSNALAVYTNIGMCPNLVGGNTLGTEFNGTFGSGKDRNRVASANVPPSYTYAIFNTGTPNDYTYGIANNTSTRVNYTTLNTWAKPDNSSPTHRVFTLWDIIGDHTGAASPTAGNPAADTVSNNNGGYMLIVNASYRIDSAFQHTIGGLCPNTYYEISCWIRNICSKCGCDSNGKGAPNTSLTPAPYIPTEVAPPGFADSSGVAPNITFEVDGIDYYTTGNIKYSGQWVKKGFTIKTGPTQTSFVLKFFNNAPGGGGNDWALDDIAVATCYPNLTVNPVPLYTTCADNVVNFGATVRSFFNNYSYYKWQRSTDAGVNWNDVGVSGTEVPVLNGGQYEYNVTYPPFVATNADSGHRYRLVVATTFANLSDPNCSSTSAADFTTLDIIQCAILPVNLVAWNVSRSGNGVKLKWITEKEFESVKYTVEKSTDGIHFRDAHFRDGKYKEGNRNTYEFTDAEIINGTAWYRLKLITADGKATYSKIILINTGNTDFNVITLDNPFSRRIRTEISVTEKADVSLTMSDAQGRKVYTKNIVAEKGSNAFTIDNMDHLAKGVYYLSVEKGAERKIIRLLKN